MVNPQRLYSTLSQYCIHKGLLTQKQSDTICRKDHRKEWAWKRHVIDLCEFVLWKIDDLQIDDVQTVELLEKTIAVCKS